MSTPHVSEELLDRYAMGTLAGEALIRVEEHLLSCSFCQNRLLDTDEFIDVFRKAAVERDARPVPLWTRLRPRWAGLAAVGAAAAALVIFTVAPSSPRPDVPPARVMMQAFRGPEAGARIVSGQSSILVFDVVVPAAPTGYEIEIVDTAGNQVLRLVPAVRDGRLTATLRKLARGSYWVRVYRTQDARELIAEYGLRAE
jgi:hypothetical protein